MYIVWHGQSFFELTLKDEEKESFSLAVSPFDKETGLRVPRMTAQVLLADSSQQADNKPIKDVFLIDQPGEYEVKGALIKAMAFSEKNIVYKITTEGMSLCHLDNFKAKELTDEQVEELGEIDILMVPVGGAETMAAKEAANVVSQIEPRMVIPMCYKLSGLKSKAEGPEKFLKLMGKEKVEKQKKIKVGLKDLSKEETEIVVLEP